VVTPGVYPEEVRNARWTVVNFSQKGFQGEGVEKTNQSYCRPMKYSTAI